MQPFPGPGAKRLISTGGGISPTWSRSKQELFYGVNGRVMLAPFTVDTYTFRPEGPRPPQRVVSRVNNHIRNHN